MKASSVWKMTAHENYRGQVLWVSVAVSACSLAFTAFVSEAALSHEGRLVDVATYFLMDFVAFITAIFMGTAMFSRDFSNRGIAEIAIPAGVSRPRLYLTRLSAHAACLALFLLALAAGRLVVMALVDAFTVAVLLDTARMLCFAFLKASLALAVGALFGCFTRPVVAILGTVGLFLLGHFSTGISGAQGVIAETRMLSPLEEILFQAFRIWNPNYLVIESLKGAWEAPSTFEFARRTAWGVAAFLFFALSGALAVRRRDVGALRL